MNTINTHTHTYTHTHIHTRARTHTHVHMHVCNALNLYIYNMHRMCLHHDHNFHYSVVFTCLIIPTCLITGRAGSRLVRLPSSNNILHFWNDYTFFWQPNFKMSMYIGNSELTVTCLLCWSHAYLRLVIDNAIQKFPGYKKWGQVRSTSLCTNFVLIHVMKICNIR